MRVHQSFTRGGAAQIAIRTEASGHKAVLRLCTRLQSTLAPAKRHCLAQSQRITPDPHNWR